MSRLSKAVAKMSERQKLKPDEIVTNFMGGDSYKLDPLETLKMIAASSIFGEASYYRNNVSDGIFRSVPRIIPDVMFRSLENKTTTEIFTEAIDKCFGFRFRGNNQACC